MSLPTVTWKHWGFIRAPPPRPAGPGRESNFRLPICLGFQILVFQRQMRPHLLDFVKLTMVHIRVPSDSFNHPSRTPWSATRFSQPKYRNVITVTVFNITFPILQHIAGKSVHRTESNLNSTVLYIEDDSPETELRFTTAVVRVRSPGRPYGSLEGRCYNLRILSEYLEFRCQYLLYQRSILTCLPGLVQKTH
jgi:hypothetical protein